MRKKNREFVKSVGWMRYLPAVKFWAWCGRLMERSMDGESVTMKTMNWIT